MARNGARAVAVDHGRAHKATARPARNAAASPRQPASVPEPAVTPVAAKPAFHERSLFAEGLGAAFRIEAGGGWATGTLPHGAGENEVAKLLSEAIGLAKQMQVAMCGDTDAAALQILVADPQTPSRQSAIEVSVKSSGGTVVTLQPGGGSHLVAMLQHFLLAANPPARAS